MNLFERLAEALRHDVPVAVATVIRPSERAGAKMLLFLSGDRYGSLEDEGLSAQVWRDGLQLLGAGTSELRTYEGYDGRETVHVFIESYAPLPRLYIMGSVHAAPALCTLAARVGYRVTVIDARAMYTTSERFPDADRIMVDWPHLALKALPPIDAATYVAVLTHDPKFEEPLLPVLLRSEARYIGLIGSRHTQAARREMLRRLGMSPDEMARLYGPIGLDIGATTPEEIALSILAEMAAVKYGRPGGSLSLLSREMRTRESSSSTSSV